MHAAIRPRHRGTDLERQDGAALAAVPFSQHRRALKKKNKQVRSILTLFSLFAIIGTLYFLREFWLARARAGALAHARATYPDRVRAFERGDEIPILVPVYGRPEYLSKVLEALIHAKDVSKSTVIFVSQDGSNPEINRLLQRAIDDGDLPIVWMHHTRPFFGLLAQFIKRCLPTGTWKTDYATAANVYGLLYFGFEDLGSQAVIVLESDLEPSYDFYAYFKWAHIGVLQHQDHQERVWSINGYSKADQPAASQAALPATSPMSSPAPGNVDPLYHLYADGFLVWGWCTSRRVWPLLRRGWTRFDNWDWAVQAARERSGRVSLSPRVTRIRNVGMKGINFDVRDGSTEARQWLAVPLPGPEGEPYEYDHQLPIVEETEAWKRAGATAARHRGE